MKTMMMLVASLAVMATSGAFAQGNSDACHNQMIPCLDQCSSRPSKALQETCSRVCENNANACYTKLYGNPSASRPQGPQDALNSAADPVKSSKPARQ
jgi:hypothetical protein